MKKTIEKLVQEAQTLMRRANASRDETSRYEYRQLSREKQRKAEKLYSHYSKQFGSEKIKGV